MVRSWGDGKILDGDRLNDKRSIGKENRIIEILVKVLY